MKTTAACFFVLLLAIASTATAQQPCSGPPHTSFANWAQFHFDECLTGFNPYEVILSPATVGNLTVKWSYTTGGRVYSSPTVVNGVVYIGSNALYALNASTGAQLWSYTNTGGNVDPAPAVVNGIVYIGTQDHRVVALNATTGAVVWSYSTGDIVDSSPTVANGVVYVGSEDSNVYALNASTGAALWSYSLGNQVFASPAVANGVGLYRLPGWQLRGTGRLHRR